MLLTLLFVIGALFWLTKKQYPKLQGKYSQRVGIRYFVKYIFAVVFLSIVSLVRRRKRNRQPELEVEDDNISKIPTENQTAANLNAFYANDKHGNALSLRFCRFQSGKVGIFMLLRLTDGRVLSRDDIVSDETPSDDEFQPDIVAADGLRIQAISPLKTFRILYSGLMRLEDETHDGGRFVEVNLRMWCRSLADAAHRAVDFHPFLLADSVAKEPWSMKLFREITKSQQIFEQHSEIRGRLEIMPVAGKDIEQLELSLHGIRHRVVGELDQQSCETYVVHRVRFDNGYVVSLTASSNPNGLTHLVEGFWHQPNGYVYAIKWSDFHLARFPSDGNAPRQYTIHFTAASKNFSLSVQLIEEDRHPVSPPSKGILFRNVAKFCLSGKTNGFGHVDVWRLDDSDHSSSTRKLLPHDNQPKSRRYVAPKTFDLSLCVALSQDACTKTIFTGGKASKLAALAASAHPGDDFAVPTGFAVTVEAYSRQVSKTPALRQGIENVLKVVRSIAEAKDDTSAKELQHKLEQSCTSLVELFCDTPLDNDVKKAIEEYLEAMFDDINEKGDLFAVRSSAVGEDSTEASGAGQMETFLGVSGKEEVFAAVKKCWGSHFAYRAVEYRRQMCAKLDSPMAVLIQQLVSADVAGVLFTRHPDTGSTARMVINASYGIGESVVSGTIDVDTITVFKLDETGENLKISYDHIGDKATALKVTEHGIETIKSPVPHSSSMDDPRYKCCLTEEEIRRMVKVGKKIESIFGAGRDVEFAICRNMGATKSTIFILQARPITTADMEQEWELLQEFDTPMASDREFMTTANVQEVMPGENCPLSCDAWLDNAAQFGERGLRGLHIRPQSRINVPRAFAVSAQHMFINYTVMGASNMSASSKAAFDMAIFGRLLHEQSIEELIEQNDTDSKLFRFFSELRQWGGRLKNPYKEMSQLEPIIHAYQVPASNDPLEMWRLLAMMLPLQRQASAAHMEVSSVSSIGNVVMMSVLEKDPRKWNMTHFADIATLLSTCTDVFSADVPTMLHDIAMSLAEPKERRQMFLGMERTEAAKWLASEELVGNTGRLYKTFMKKHGHRCVRDIEIREKSWHMEPEKVVDVLQTMLKSQELTAVHSEKKPLDINEAIDSLQNPVNRVQRFLLKLILPRVRTAVGRREWAKSLIIKLLDYSRIAFFSLAQLLTNQGILPDGDLIFFLTGKELEYLLHHRSPKLIARALRRRKLMPKLSEMHFEEVVAGYPKLTKTEASVNTSGDFVLEGTPVGQGSITGLARVVTSLSEANQIQNGEILVVPYTDVGWTPYFPLIAGLVTELGGLISHGAVVAREYGLPCVVGCKQATHLVKTGDTITIEGRTGKVCVLRQEN